ncbi:MAG: rod shape-determining protein MreC [Acidobacteria bacterium]|nr:rod shape-determining protein MreC [Acidobacteriota bacterium]
MSSELPSRVNGQRSAAVLIPLLVLQLALLSLQIKTPSGTLLFKSWTMAAQAPVLSLFARITGGVGDFWRGYFWLVGARAENEALREAVQRLSLLNGAYEQSRLENERLRRLLTLSDSIERRALGARVTARAPSFLANLVYIDRGKRHGVRVDAPVISGEGIVGRVLLVSADQAQVQLITNPGAAIGVMLENSRTPGVLAGTGDPLLELKYIGDTDPVAVGEVVLSSGLDGILPKGMTIGRVVEVEKGKGVFQAIRVKPLVDLIHLEEVAVLLDPPITETSSRIP